MPQQNLQKLIHAVFLKLTTAMLFLFASIKRSWCCKNFNKIQEDKAYQLPTVASNKIQDSI